MWGSRRLTGTHKSHFNSFLYPGIAEKLSASQEGLSLIVLVIELF